MKKQITVEIDVVRHDERRCGGCAYQGWNCCEDPWCWLFDCGLDQKPYYVYLRCSECIEQAVDVEELTTKRHKLELSACPCGKTDRIEIVRITNAVSVACDTCGYYVQVPAKEEVLDTNIVTLRDLTRAVAAWNRVLDVGVS